MLRIMIVTIKIIRTIWINNNNNHNIKNRIVQNNEKVSKTTTLILTKATLKNKKKSTSFLFYKQTGRYIGRESERGEALQGSFAETLNITRDVLFARCSFCN